LAILPKPLGQLLQTSAEDGTQPATASSAAEPSKQIIQAGGERRPPVI
jgi:hypothetical protein